MPNTDLNGENARLIEDQFRARRPVGVLGIGGRRLTTATAERFAGTLSAFRAGLQGVSPCSRSQQPISSATKFATNPGSIPASAAQTVARRLACTAFLDRRADPQGASGPRLVLRTVAGEAPISKYAAGALADATPPKATRRGRRCSQ
jgi:hypothetical protein